MTILLERKGGSAVVPLDLSVRAAPQSLSVESIPSEPVRYRIQVGESRYIKIYATSTHGGVTDVYINYYDDFGDNQPVESLIVTSSDKVGGTRQRLVRRLGPGQFIAAVTLPTDGWTAVAVVGHTPDGTRFRAVVHLRAAVRS